MEIEEYNCGGNSPSRSIVISMGGLPWIGKTTYKLMKKHLFGDMVSEDHTSEGLKK